MARSTRRGRSSGPMASSIFAQAGAAAKYILARTPLRPRVAVVLGTGLGAFADRFTDGRKDVRNRAVRIDYAKIPHFPVSTALGHSGRLILGRVDGLPVAVMAGRVHLYEGYSPQQVAFPMRVLSRLGIRAVILTNAAGGISPDYRTGAFVLLRDHINLQASNPLIGPNDERFGVRFPDLTRVHWPPYRDFARQAAGKLGFELFEGVYAGLAGPSYETSAEIRYLRIIGADLVGMSTVPEIIAAAHLGIRVLAISCVTNMAAGMSGAPITAEEVFETGARVQDRMAALLDALIPRIDADLQVARDVPKGKRS